MLRAAVNAGTPLGLAARTIMDEGKLVPDELIVDQVKQRIAKADCLDGFLFDGFPRTIAPAKALRDAGTRIGYMPEIAVDGARIIEHPAGRRVRLASGRTYHGAFNPPESAGKDDNTGEDPIQSEDDNEDTVRRRLAVYHAQTNRCCSITRRGRQAVMRECRSS